MSDTAYPVFQHYGTNAQRLAFTPVPASGTQPIYIWYETDTDKVFAYTTAWHQISSSASGSAISALTGDVTATGPGSVAATIANNAVTTAKIATTAVTLARIADASANDKLLGSGNSGSGASYAEITLGTGLTMTGTTLSSSGGSGTVTTTGSPASGNLTKFTGSSSISNADLTGDVTTSGTVATTIANSAVTLAKIANAAASSKLVGSGASGSGSAYTELTLGTNLSMSGTTLNATAGATGALVLLEQHTASSSASLDFTTCITSTYDTYRIEFVNLVPATNNVDFYMRVSTNGGSSYDSAGNYASAIFAYTSGGSGLAGQNAFATALIMRGVADISNSGVLGVTGNDMLYDPLSTSNQKRTVGQLSYWTSSGTVVGIQRAGIYQISGTAVNAFQYFFSSGNIASGTIRVYGVAK